MAKAPAERGPLGVSLSSYLCPDTDGDTLKAAKVWTLTEVLVREKQQCLEAKSQQKEQLVLLEKKRTTYSQVCGQRPAPLPGVWPAACPPPRCVASGLPSSQVCGQRPAPLYLTPGLPFS